MVQLSLQWIFQLVHASKAIVFLFFINMPKHISSLFRQTADVGVKLCYGPKMAVKKNRLGFICVHDRAKKKPGSGDQL